MSSKFDLARFSDVSNESSQPLYFSLSWSENNPMFSVTKLLRSGIGRSMLTRNHQVIAGELVVASPVL